MLEMRTNDGQTENCQFVSFSEMKTLLILRGERRYESNRIYVFGVRVGGTRYLLIRTER